MKLSEALTEGLKELLRVVIIAVLPVVILSLEKGEVDYRLIIITGVIAALRALDKWLHEKDVKTPLDLKGLDVLKK